MEGGPFLLGGAAVLVDDLHRHVDLADVVQQRGPTEAVHVVSAEAQLVADQRGVGLDPLTVGAGACVVRGEGRHQVQ